MFHFIHLFIIIFSSRYLIFFFTLLDSGFQCMAKPQKDYTNNILLKTKNLFFFIILFF